MMKRLLAQLGLVKLVWLRDFDGQLTLTKRRGCCARGGYFAYRYGEIVLLNADGTCTSGTASFVKKWKAYKPGTSPRYAFDLEEIKSELLDVATHRDTLLGQMNNRVKVLEERALSKNQGKKKSK